MLDHPYISNPDYTTTIVSWQDGGLRFFEPVKYGSDGFVILDVFYLSYLIVFLVSIALLRIWQKRGSLKIAPELCFDTVLVAVAGSAFGGRLGEAVFYNPKYFFLDPWEMVVNDWHVLFTAKPWRLFTNASGMTIHGVIIGGIVAVYIWSRWIRKPFLHILDQGTIIIAFGTILGRIANFMAGELWGRASDLPWATRFPMRGYLSRAVYADGSGKTYMLVRETVTTKGPDGKEVEQVIGHLEPWQVDQGFEVLKDRPAEMIRMGSGDAQAPWAIVWQTVTDPRHPVQLYQALADGLLLLIIMSIIRWRTKRVGVLTSSFLILYGLIRTSMEMFRQPEPGIGFILGLTRGQLLSLAMVLGGILVAVVIKRRPLLIADIPVKTAKPAEASGEKALIPVPSKEMSAAPKSTKPDPVA